MEVKPPFIKKKFGGGMYAAHMILFGAFEEWQWLFDWVRQSEKYAFVPGDHACMDGLLEEHLNYIGNLTLSPDELYKTLQLYLLIPVKQK